MASMQSGVQLWTCAHAAEVLLELGARVDVVDSVGGGGFGGGLGGGDGGGVC